MKARSRIHPSNRVTYIFVLISFVSACLAPHPAAAATGAIPHHVQITDPAGDANGLNNQGIVDEPISDEALPAQPEPAADILKGWFTQDRRTVSAHLQVASTKVSVPLSYRVRANVTPVDDDVPGLGLVDCLVFVAHLHAGTAGPLEKSSSGSFYDCNRPDESSTPRAPIYFRGKLVVTNNPDGTGTITITVARSLLPPKGSVLHAPTADSRILIENPDREKRSGTGALTIDDTRPGKNYVLK